jgi:hypothetical protein
MMAEDSMFRHWWRDSPMFVVTTSGRSAARLGADDWFQKFWRIHENVAWQYELVRRFAFTQSPAAKQYRDWAASTAPYDELSLAMQDGLWLFMPDKLKFVPPALYNLTNIQPRNPAFARRPPVSFNQKVATEKDLAELELRERASGAKGGKSRNVNQSKRKNWRLLELLEGDCPPTQRGKKTRAINEAKQVAADVIAAWGKASLPLSRALVDEHLPYIDGVTGIPFRMVDVLEIIKRHAKR